jgi:hypothetical protein
MQPTTTGQAAGATRDKFEQRGAEIIDQAKQKAGQVYNQASRSMNE